MRLSNFLALACGIALGATLTTIGLNGKFHLFRPKPPVRLIFRPLYDPDLLVAINRLRAAGEQDADLANLVVAEFDRHSLDRLENRPSDLELGRRTAIEDMVRKPAAEAWRKQAVLRCLRPDDLELTPAEADQLYAVWRDWDAKSSSVQLTWTSSQDVMGGHKYLREQIHQMATYERRLERLLGPERFDRFASTHIAGWEWLRTKPARSVTPRERIAIKKIEIQMWDRVLTYLIAHHVVSSMGFGDQSVTEHLTPIWDEEKAQENRILNGSESIW